MELTRRNRHSTKPLPGRTPVVIKTPSETHLKIFRIHHPQLGFQFLPSHWSHRFLDVYQTKHGLNDYVQILGHLKEEQNNYLFWPEQQEYSKNSNSQSPFFRIEAIEP